MLQTEGQIEAFFYKAIKNSDLGKAIRGKVYRWGQRPDNATTEDIAVKCLTADAEQLQGGTLLVNVYVPNITSNRKEVSDSKRIDELAHLAERFCWDFRCDDGYDIELEKMPYSAPIDNINQTRLTVRLTFSRMAS